MCEGIREERKRMNSKKGKAFLDVTNFSGCSWFFKTLKKEREKEARRH